MSARLLHIPVTGCALHLLKGDDFVFGNVVFLVQGVCVCVYVCRRGGGGVISFVPGALSGMGWLHVENKRAHARDANHFSQ